MRLTVLGSGSRGNALLIECGDDALLVDAGFSLKQLGRRAASAGAALSRVRGVALTHEHGDHSRGAARAAAEWSVPIAASTGTLQAMRDHLPQEVTTVRLLPVRSAMVSSFRLTAYPTAHDARDPIMLVVEGHDGRRVGIAYDVGTPTAALRHACRGLDALVIESNHDEVLLRSSDYPPSVRARIAGRSGHLSNNQAAALAAGIAHSGLGAVILVHLSERCNTPELALDVMRTALKGTKFTGRLIAAAQDEPSPSVDLGASLGQLVLPLGA